MISTDPIPFLTELISPLGSAPLGVSVFELELLATTVMKLFFLTLTWLLLVWALAIDCWLDDVTFSSMRWLWLVLCELSSWLLICLMLSSASLRTLSCVEQRLLLLRLLSIELSFALKSLTLFRLDIVGVGQSCKLLPPFFDDWFG